MSLWYLTWRSLLNRKLASLLTIISIGLSVTMLLGVERIRMEARASFANTISGTDLVVGSRGGAVQLLLYSVFRIGNATNNIDWKSIEAIAALEDVDWIIPISLGDSHRGFRVVGTNEQYFKHYRHGSKQPLEFAAGEPFDGLFDAVLGAEVARKLNYQVGSKMVVAHGTGNINLRSHDDKPFTVVGVLKPTGTPVDRAVHVSLEAIEAIHLNWQSGSPIPGLDIRADQVTKFNLKPKEVTAALVGLDSRIATFSVQRFINEFQGEPLQAILPGVALQELWSLLAVAEQALLAVSILVVLVGLLGMVTVILNSLNDRRRELAILRSVGARPRDIFVLLSSEAALVSAGGIALGTALLYLGLIIARPLLLDYAGLAIQIRMLSSYEWSLLGMVMAAALVISVIPGYRAFRLSLSDGLTIKL
ncbi:MAG: ABC transporter permease [Gammaproteobacteria bacterium]